MTEVNQFWDQQAREHGSASTATAPDPHYRELEIRSIMPYLSNGSKILDVGCGNGYATVKFAKAYPLSKFTGLDISEEMIAKAPKCKNARFMVGNVLGALPTGWDAIICTRCLINLDSWIAQQAALENMREALRKGGDLILVENTLQGLDALNGLRGRFGLHEIKTRWHNIYFDLHELRIFLRRNFEVLSETNIGNLYYILSRVVNAKLAQADGREPQYGDAVNAIAAQLPSLGSYGFSPNYLWHLRKR